MASSFGQSSLTADAAHSHSAPSAAESVAPGARSAWQALLATDAGVAPLVMRVTLAVVMWPHGAQKLLGWFGGYGFEGTMGFFTQALGVPSPVALLVVLGEFFGPILLLLGAATRFVAGSFILIMLGAALMVHAQNGFFMNWSGAQAGEGFEYHLLAIGMSLALVLTGAGRASVDRWLSRR
jgi:putative oxidoreductase